MTAASVAALTVYDMVKGIERGVEIVGGHAAREDRRQRGLAPLKAAVLTVSSSLARGEGEDVSGPELVALLRARPGSR